MDEADSAECKVVLHHMMTMLGMATWTVGCEHRGLAVIGEAWGDNVIYVTLILEHKEVIIKLHRNHLPQIAEEKLGQAREDAAWELPDNV